MLSEKTVSKIAFAFSLIGFLALFLLSALEKPELLKISEIQGSNASIVQVNARIVSSSFANNAWFLRLFDGNSLSAIVYNPSPEALSIASKNSLISATGSLRKSKNSKTLIVSRLWKIA